MHPQRLAPRTVTLTATAVTAKWLCLRPVSVGGGCRRSSRNNRNENIEGSSWFKSYTCSSWFCARHSHSSRHVCIIITCHARTVTCHSHKNDKMSKTCLVSQYIPSLGLISIYVVVFHRQPHGVMTQTVSSDSSQLLPLKVRGGGSGSLNRFGLHRQRDTRPTGDSDDCDLGPECTRGQGRVWMEATKSF